MTGVTVDREALHTLVVAAWRGDPPDQLAAAVAALVATAPPQRTPRPFLSIDDTADALGVSVSTVRRRVADGTLPHRRVGRRIVVPAAALTVRGQQ